MTAIILHGGATNLPAAKTEKTMEGLEAALALGTDMLDRGTRATDVVECVVSALEDNPVFNAGTGSQTTRSGEIEMDAMIVDGATLGIGAVIGIRNVRNPVQVARRVMEETPHCILSGDGAMHFAWSQGFDYVPTETLASTWKQDTSHDTVGAVALDAEGNIASATSTGGVAQKMLGRVGDSPLIGSGAIAQNGIGGASATGKGEALMRIMISRTVNDLMERGAQPMDAARLAIKTLERAVQGTGGIICIDAAGNIGFAHNSPHMGVAAVDATGTKTVRLGAA